jgi:hypothetical protein
MQKRSIPLPTLVFAALLALVAGCTPSGAGKSSAGPSTEAPLTNSAPAIPSASTAPESRAATPPSKSGEPCGELGCRAFASAEDAFAQVLEQKPLVLGIGEAHAQKSSENVTSTTKRFSDSLLPALKGKASFLLVELMMPNDKCKKETAQVKKQQKPVTEPQAETNQNEYVALGQKAKSLGIVPDLLRPSCDDLTRITQAGAADIGVMLETIARLTHDVVKTEVGRNKQSGKDAMVVAYGGALHNDLEPKSGRESWSYGPKLSEETAKRYVELDLIVPEYIKDTETWTSLAWYSKYDRARLGDKAVLFNPRPGSYVLIFPTSSPSP